MSGHPVPESKGDLRQERLGIQQADEGLRAVFGLAVVDGADHGSVQAFAPEGNHHPTAHAHPSRMLRGNRIGQQAGKGQGRMTSTYCTQSESTLASGLNMPLVNP